MFLFYDLYLPVAEMSTSFAILVMMGLGVGIIAGMFGIGSAMLSIPILIFLGIPAKIAVATASTQMIAASFSNYLVYAKKKLVDYKLAFFILAGSTTGTLLGMKIFYSLLTMGKLDIVVGIGFVIVLSAVGMFSFAEAATIIYYRYKRLVRPNRKPPYWVYSFGLIKKTKFFSIREEISILYPFAIGAFSSLMLTIMGIGGSIIIIPIMLYLLGVSPAYITGTVHLPLAVSSLITCTIHTLSSHNVDIVLAATLVIGTSLGAQVGANLSAKLSANTFKLLLAVVLLFICTKVGVDLFAKPQEIYQIEMI